MLHFTSSSVTIYVKWTTPLNNYAVDHLKSIDLGIKKYILSMLFLK